MLPGCANGVESGDDAWNINGSPLWNFNFGHQNGQGKNDAVEEERDHVSYDFPNEEEAVDHVELFPYIHSLHPSNKTNLYVLFVS